MATLEKKDITDLLALLLATPILAVWSLISFLPFFQLFARGNSVGVLLVQGVFFVTGALGVGAIWGGLWLLMRSEVRAAISSYNRTTVLKLALYGGAWLISYGVYCAI